MTDLSVPTDRELNSAIAQVANEFSMTTDKHARHRKRGVCPVVPQGRQVGTERSFAASRGEGKARRDPLGTSSERDASRGANRADIQWHVDASILRGTRIAIARLA